MCQQWLALRVKSNFEHYVSLSLTGKSLEVFLPTYVRKIEKPGSSEVRRPLFPGYVFSRLDYQQHFTVMKIPGVVGFVGIGKRPLPVDEEEISAVRRMVESQLPMWPCPFLKVGQRVPLTSGPLRGLEGIVLSISGSWQIVMTITLLQRSVAVKVSPDWIRCR
jgi:transcription antitermination factor NusG